MLGRNSLKDFIGDVNDDEDTTPNMVNFFVTACAVFVGLVVIATNHVDTKSVNWHSYQELRNVVVEEKTDRQTDRLKRDTMVTVYVSTVSSNMETKKHQQKIEMVLHSKKIAFSVVDVADSEDNKKKMREIAGDSKALPPQIANGDTYCGDFAQFDAALEHGTLNEFLKI